MRQSPGRQQTLPLVSAAIAILMMSGCAGMGTSRWAMDDPVYSEKYSHPYPGNDAEKVARMVKQSVDARYVSGRGGAYGGMAISPDPVTAGADIGAFYYFNSAVEGRVGLKGLLGTGAEDWFLGGDAGLRFQAPSRFAPFVGVGTFLGANRKEELAINDHIDNDGDGSVDERGEHDGVYSHFSSVYPEVGAHLWLTSNTRLTTSAQYHVTTEGRDADFWFFGVSLAFLSGGPSSDADDFKPLPDAE